MIYSEWIGQRIQDPDLYEWAASRLMQLCEIDTTIRPDVEAMIEAEKASFTLLESEWQVWLDQHCVTRRPVDSSIDEHPDYTIQGYGENSKTLYENRSNLHAAPLKHQAPRWLLNGHIDTVPPHIPPTRTSEVIRGRGTADNKGALVVELLVLRLLKEWCDASGQDFRDRLELTVSIDEETGGNGTLGLLPYLDLSEKTVVVLEPTQSAVFPANRGALWFQIDVKTSSENARIRFPEIFSCLVLRLHQEGCDLRENFPHELFDPEDVQTCFGLINQFGGFPSSACEEISFGVRMDVLRPSLSDKTLEAWIDECFCEADQVGLLSVEVGLLSVTPIDSSCLKVTIGAQGGHMGSRKRDTDAIVKTAWLIQRICQDFPGAVFWLDESAAWKIEGGQGFLPSCSIDEVRSRLKNACSAVVEDLKNQFSFTHDELEVTIRHDKIHNAAYSSGADSRGTRCLQQALATLQPDKDHPPPRGWQASCDARLFARTGEDVITFGAGSLNVAHSADEEVDIQDLLEVGAALCLAVAMEDA